MKNQTSVPTIKALIEQISNSQYFKNSWPKSHATLLAKECSAIIQYFAMVKPFAAKIDVKEDSVRVSYSKGAGRVTLCPLKREIALPYIKQLFA